MAFIYEKISEEDKQKNDFSKLQIGWLNRPDPTYWIIDRVSGDFLIWLRQEREPPHVDWYIFKKNDGKTFGASILWEGGSNTAEGKPTVVGLLKEIWQPDHQASYLSKDDPILSKILESAMLDQQTSWDQTTWGTIVEKIVIEETVKGIQK
jgi:hypothetical protein